MAAHPTPPGPAPFAPLQREARLSHRVSEALSEAILARQYKPGDRVPSERALMEQFGVSRTVIREAIQTVVARGLLEAHPRKGYRVNRMDAAGVTESMSLYLRGAPEVDYDQLTEVRGVLEVAIAGIAARRASPAQIDLLAGCNEAFAGAQAPEEAAAADNAFHRAIAEATGNPFFVLSLDSLRGVMVEIWVRGLATAAVRREVFAEHEAVLAAIRAADADAAEAAMDEHIRHAVARWRASA